MPLKKYNFSFFCLKYVGNTSFSYEISKNPFSSLKGKKFHERMNFYEINI